MNRQIIKPIIGGLLLGTALFLVPFFVLKVLIFFLVIGLLFRLFGRRRHRGPWGWALADKIRTMSEEEYNDYKTKWRRGGCHGYYSKDVQTENQ